MKVLVLLAVLLCVCTIPASAWFGGGGRSSSSSRSGSRSSSRHSSSISSSSNSNNDNSGNDNKSKDKSKDEGKTTTDVRVKTTKDGGTEVSGGISHEGDGFSGGVKGTVDSNGDWGIEADVTFELGKRSTDTNGRHFSVRVDPCNFKVYDTNNDGVIVKSEMMSLFGEHKKAETLFEALDMTTGDGVIEEDEFYFMTGMTILECKDKISV